jgi:hypothetical protein
MGEQEVSNPMIKRVLFSILLMATVFTCVNLANIPTYRLKFKVNSPYLLEENARLAVPPGEYWVKDMGTGPGHLLSLQRASDLKHLAWLNTVRIDRARLNWRDEPSVRFDYENTVLPVVKEFYLPGTDGYEIVDVHYNDESKYFIDIATLSKTKYTITEREIVETMPEPAPAAEPEPAPAAEPEPEPAPAVEPQPAPVEEPQPVEPIRERKRVRKD